MIKKKTFREFMTEQVFLGQLLIDIYKATAKAGNQADQLPTAADLARKHGFRLEAVKKKLKHLKSEQLIQPIGMTPKRYRFNHWEFALLQDDHPLYPIFCEPSSDYFISKDPLSRV
jgi:hypothetical protein